MTQKYLRVTRWEVTIIKAINDIYQLPAWGCRYFCRSMVFSKSFGYALRGILYLAMQADTREKVQLDEIAEKLGVPRHFLGKVMKRMVKEGVLNSLKGPYGGFYVNEKTMATPLFKLVEITGETDEFNTCALRLRKCNAESPCPLHRQIESLRQQWMRLLSSTTVHDLLKKDHPGFIRSIAVV
ncbi:MAG: RrF2 family transcriptional regulator [Bacteroidota bacterium]